MDLTTVCNVFTHSRWLVGSHYAFGWLGGTTGSASDQRSEGCGFEAY